jgi:DNA-binding MarR family transcriptional regulator
VGATEGTLGGPKRALAGEVWRMMAEFSFAMTQRGRHFGALKELGLTPGHLKMLGVLDAGGPRPMGALADACHCDPSMATWLVDRLEERGLVERRMHPTDRRVKTVALTERGLATKRELFAQMYDPPAELLALDRKTLERLKRELAKLPSVEHPFRPAAASSRQDAEVAQPGSGA